ncbi:hypothetical protein Zm00014a_044502 [Zea mays]|uniref:Uncharacterized protein n=1 Tax=Zea mays TaxID=4577 RepID=A0A3L6FHN4_MAIZE|nr:hypothetical protein Zm00014a_044502 [Zea mays]
MCCFVLFCGGEEPRVLCGGEGKSFNARRRSKLCANRNRHRPYKHRLGCLW